LVTVGLARLFYFAPWEQGHLALIDPVGIGDDRTLCCLPKNLCEPARREDVRFDDVAKRTPRTDRRQLINITDQDQCRMPGDCPNQLMGQHNIEHAGLVDVDPLLSASRFPAEASRCLRVGDDAPGSC
jgi:hypothetical protein